MPTIAILLATYNGEKYLKEQLDSLLSQTMTDWHCYVHDDGSTDGTVNILNEYSERMPDRFTILNYPATGSAKKNFMSIMKYVKEPYAMFCDQDDAWLPYKIKASFDRISQLETDIPVLVHTDLIVADDRMNPISDSFYGYSGIHKVFGSYEHYLVENNIVGCTSIINRPLMNEAMKCNPANIYMHDWWCALIASAAGKIELIDTSTVLYRQHGNNQIGAGKKQCPIERDIGRLLSKEQRAKKIKQYERERIQAEEILKLNIISEEKRKIAETFFNLDNFPFTERMRLNRRILKYGRFEAFECALTAKPLNYR